MVSLEFLLTSLVVALIPGTGVVFTVSTGLIYGWRASLAAAWGCTLGILPHLLVSGLGLAAVLHMGAFVFSFIKLAGASYLLYLAWGTWQDRSFLSFEHSEQSNQTNTVTRAILLNILNPKLSIFFLAFLPQFMNPKTSVLPQMLVLSGVFMLITLLVFVLYGLLAHSIRGWVLRSEAAQRWFKRSFAAVFAALGINLAFSSR